MAAEQHEQPVKLSKRPVIKDDGASLIRVLGRDIRGDKKLFVGLTQIKGISFSFANAACVFLNLDKNKKIQDMSRPEIELVENFIKNPQIPSFMKNRTKDLDDGSDKHIFVEDIKLRR